MSARGEVGVIGAGAIASAVCAHLLRGDVSCARLGPVLVRGDGSALPPRTRTVRSLEELVSAGPRLVVEAASSDAVSSYGPPLVAKGIDLVVVSTGALLEPEVRARLAAAAAEGGGRVRLVTGAIGAVDALRAAAVDGLESVEVEQRKPATSLLSAEEAARLETPRIVFEGSVADAVKTFPKTTNILATVALAGLGPNQTRVRIVADPEASSNQARVHARGRFGSFDFGIDNRPSSNPRSSLITALSVISALRALLDPIEVA